MTSCRTCGVELTAGNRLASDAAKGARWCKNCRRAYHNADQRRRAKFRWEQSTAARAASLGQLTRTRKFSEFEKGWLAAAIDGEGSIVLGTRREARYVSYTVRLDITNTNYSFCLKAMEMTGVGSIEVTEYDDHPEWSTKFKWVVNSYRPIFEILSQVAPYLVVKRVKAENLLGYLRLRLIQGGVRRDHLPESEREKLERAQVIFKIGDVV